MYVDPRPYKIGYNPTFLNRKNPDNILARRDIARGYIAGTPAKELAQQYGITVQKVLAIVRWYDAELFKAKRLAAAVASPKSRTQQKAKATVAPIKVAADADTYVVTKPFYGGNDTDIRVTRITLPLLSIQRKAA